VKKIVVCILLAGGVFSATMNALAWGSAGHMVVAAIGYRTLSPQMKADAFEILKAHPQFSEWTNAYRPNALVDLPAYVFMRSSTWPDEIRRRGSPYDHPNWHFIDYPLRPPKLALESDNRPTDNILYGIAQCETTLRDTNANPELRAAYLSFLIHLVGDLHQPLHCESLFTDVYPNGDKGGNDFYVKAGDRGMKLHALWDGLLGSSANPQAQWKYAITLESEFPKAALSVLASDTTPKVWSLESRQLAIEKGYLDGALVGSTQAGSAPPLPDGYVTAAKSVAERQGVVAGYRLAAEIERNLKVGINVPLLPANTNAIVHAVPHRIGSAEAVRFYNETMTVTGKVASVSVRANVVLINLDAPYPQSPFTAVVFPENFGHFGDLRSLKDKSVEITGDITEYRNKPEIVMESAAQLKLVGGD